MAQRANTGGLILQRGCLVHWWRQHFFCLPSPWPLCGWLRDLFPQRISSGFSSCFPLEEPVAQQTSIMILGSRAGGNLSRNSPPNAQKLSPGAACLYLATSMPFCYRALTLCQVLGCKLYLFLHLTLSAAPGGCHQLHFIGEKTESGRAGSSCPESLAELGLELRAVWFLRNGKAVEYVSRHFLD